MILNGLYLAGLPEEVNDSQSTGSFSVMAV